MIRPTFAEKAIRRTRLPKILPQRPTFVLAAEDAAPLQLRNNAVDEIVEAAGRIREHDVEPVAMIGWGDLWMAGREGLSKPSVKQP